MGFLSRHPFQPPPVSFLLERHPWPDSTVEHPRGGFGLSIAHRPDRPASKRGNRLLSPGEKEARDERAVGVGEAATAALQGEPGRVRRLPGHSILKVLSLWDVTSPAYLPYLVISWGVCVHSFIEESRFPATQEALITVTVLLRHQLPSSCARPPDTLHDVY